MKQHRLLIATGSDLVHDQTYSSRTELTAGLIETLWARNPKLNPSLHSSRPFTRAEDLTAVRDAYLDASASDRMELTSPGTAVAESYLDGMAGQLAAEGLVVHTLITDTPAAKPPVTEKKPTPRTLKPAPGKFHHLMLVSGDDVEINRLYSSRNALAYDLIQCLTTGTPDLGLETEEAEQTLREIYVEAAQADYSEGQSFGSMAPEDYLDSLTDWLASVGITMHTGTIESPAPETSPAPSTYTPK